MAGGFAAEWAALLSDSRRECTSFDFRLQERTEPERNLCLGRRGARLQVMLLGPLLSLPGRKKIRFFLAKLNKKDLVFVKDLLEAGKIVPVIARRYPLSEVAEALRYLEQGHAQGKVVITVEHSGEAR